MLANGLTSGLTFEETTCSIKYCITYVVNMCGLLVSHISSMFFELWDFLLEVTWVDLPLKSLSELK